MDLIEKRYGVLIDYVDPRYSAPSDVQMVYSVRGTPVRRPFPIPLVRTISIHYTQASGKPKGVPYLSSCSADTMGCAPVTAWPQGGMTELIQQVLNRFATQGGQVFLVRKIEMPYGPRWEVYPEEARNKAGTFVFQPDLLARSVFLPSRPPMPRSIVVGSKAYWRNYVPKLRHAERAFSGSIYEQLEAAWGNRFRVAGETPSATHSPAAEAGGESMSAWRALTKSMGKTWVLRLLYAPDNGTYYPHIVRMPYREPPRPPTPKAVPAHMVPAHRFPLGFWMSGRNSPRLIPRIQGALAKAGYLHTPATNKWDANAVNALRGFQIAHGLRPTGKFDNETSSALLPFLPMVPAHLVPAKPAMDAQLSYWLQSTPDGQKEIAQALKKAGFYTGPTARVSELKIRKALKAFQSANGLRTTGDLDDPTADKLTPYLPKPESLPRA